MSMTGSSPLARGLRGVGMVRDLVEGIIPARAGFTGELDPLPAPGCGSSPLARGLHPFSGGLDDRVGIIPARAGFTLADDVLNLAVTDHPRSRGVYIYLTYL